MENSRQECYVKPFVLLCICYPQLLFFRSTASSVHRLGCSESDTSDDDAWYIGDMPHRRQEVMNTVQRMTGQIPSPDRITPLFQQCQEELKSACPALFSRRSHKYAEAAARFDRWKEPAEVPRELWWGSALCALIECLVVTIYMANAEYWWSRVMPSNPKIPQLPQAITRARANNREINPCLN